MQVGKRAGSTTLAQVVTGSDDRGDSLLAPALESYAKGPAVVADPASVPVVESVATATNAVAESWTQSATAPWAETVVCAHARVTS